LGTCGPYCVRLHCRRILANRRIDDIKTWLESEFKRIDEKFQTVNGKLDMLDSRIKNLENARNSGVLIGR
jgi:hypothetical protein